VALLTLPYYAEKGRKKKRGKKVSRYHRAEGGRGETASVYNHSWERTVNFKQVSGVKTRGGTDKSFFFWRKREQSLTQKRFSGPAVKGKGEGVRTSLLLLSKERGG